MIANSLKSIRVLKRSIVSAAGLTLALSLIFISACGKKADQGPATVDELKLPGDLCDFIMTDIDGDSLREIIALTCDTSRTETGRKASVFYQSDHRYGLSPRIVIDLPENAVVFDTGDIDGDGRPELLYLAGDGLYAIAINSDGAGNPKRVITDDSIFLIHTPRSVAYWDFFKPQANTDRSIAIMPSLNVVNIYAISKGIISKSGEIPVQFKARSHGRSVSESRDLQQLAFDFRLPVFEMMDYNGDGIEDLYVIDDGDVDIYTRSFDGSLSGQPVARTNGRFRQQTGDAVSYADIVARDINGDGLGDLLVSHYIGGVKNLESRIDVYLCRAREGHDSQPSFSRLIKNSAGMALLPDFNHDGRTDIVIPALKIGILALVKMLVLDHVDLGLEIFLQEPGGQFPAEPSMSTTIRASADLNSDNINFGNNIAAGGDFNGDGLCDFLVETGKGNLNIYFGTVGSVLAPEPGWRYRLPGQPSSILAVDCDNDSISEILAFYSGSSSDNGEIAVIHVGQ